MRSRHPLPRLWLMTDERMGEALWAALDRLPRGAGVVVRHHATEAAERAPIVARILAIARRRGLMVITAGQRARGTAGVHNPRRGTVHSGLVTRSAHGLREAIAAGRAGAALIFLSPVFATRSHPGSATLGRVRFARTARQVAVPVVALGGMDAARFRSLPYAYGWAAIDAWLR